MIRYLRRLLFVMFGTCLYSTAVAGSSADVSAALTRAVGEPLSVLSYAVADFDMDGLQDWVGVLKIERESGPYVRLYVLKRKADGFNVVAMSRTVEFIDCAGRCGVEIVSAKPRNFFVNQYNRGGWGHASATTQFALRKGRWRGIGQQRTNIDARFDREETSDTNLLTGRYKSTSVSGGMSSRPKPARAKSGTRKKSIPLWLEDFDPVYF